MRRAVGAGREGRELLLQMLLAAGGAFYALRATHQFLELVSAVFAKVFKDRHNLLHKR